MDKIYDYSPRRKMLLKPGMKIKGIGEDCFKKIISDLYVA
jgi:hypothetical protein